MRTVRSLLHPEDLSELIEREYQIPSPVMTTLLQRGFNDAYLIVDGRGDRRMFRVYARDKYWLRSEGEVLFELELLDYLAAHGRAVAHPYRRKSGELTGRLQAPEGARDYALFTFAAGRPLAGHPFDRELWHAVGSEVARLHGTMDAFVSEHSRYHLDLTMLVDMPLAAIEPYVTTGEKSTYLELTELAHGLKDAVSNAGWDPGTYGLIHADTHDGNIHVTADGSFTLFDFDHCAYGWRAYDLMPYYRPPTATDEIDLQKSEAFLTGYDTVRTISPAERELFPVFRALRALWDIGDWLQATTWTGDAWARHGLCERALTRLSEPLG